MKKARVFRIQVRVTSRQLEGTTMRRILLSFASASAILSATVVLAPAGAMTVGTASGLQVAIDQTSALDPVVYVCKHRYYSSRRVCWWRPGGYTWKPWRRWRRL
jgi:hypothetical protein